MKVLKIIGGVFLVIVIASGIIGVISPGNSPLVNHQMNSISNKVAEDAIEQYNIAERNNDKMQMYAQASMASQAYLQAKDEDNYKKWKDIADAAQNSMMGK